MMGIATVTGPVYGASFTDSFVDMRLIFELSHWEQEANVGTFVGGPIQVPVDQNGDFTVDLFVNGDGENVSNYKVYVEYTKLDSYRKRIYLGYFALTSGITTRLDELDIITDQETQNQLDVYGLALSLVNNGASYVQESEQNAIAAAQSAALLDYTVTPYAKTLLDDTDEASIYSTLNLGDVVKKDFSDDPDFTTHIEKTVSRGAIKTLVDIATSKVETFAIATVLISGGGTPSLVYDVGFDGVFALSVGKYVYSFPTERYVGTYHVSVSPQTNPSDFRIFYAITSMNQYGFTVSFVDFNNNPIDVEHSITVSQKPN